MLIDDLGANMALLEMLIHVLRPWYSYCRHMSFNRGLQCLLIESPKTTASPERFLFIWDYFAATPQMVVAHLGLDNVIQPTEPNVAPFTMEFTMPQC